MINQINNTSIRERDNKNNREVNTSLFFKPLIATSLALSLGSDLLVAQPELKVNDTTAIQPKDIKLGWNNGGNFWQPVPNPSGAPSPTPLQVLKFDLGTNTEPDTLSGTLNEDNTKLTVKSSTSVSSITLTGDTKGILINNGMGAMNVNFNNSLTTPQTFTLDLSKTSESDTSFKGKISIGGGQRGSIFNGKFGKDLESKVTLWQGGPDAGDDDNKGHITAKMQFGNGAKLKGDLYLDQENKNNQETPAGQENKRQITFDFFSNTGSTDTIMEGDIRGNGSGTATFEQGSLKGSIFNHNFSDSDNGQSNVDGDQGRNYPQKTVTFKLGSLLKRTEPQGGDSGGNIINKNLKGTVTVNFEGTNQSIEGNIKTGRENNEALQYLETTNINFTGGGTYKVGGDVTTLGRHTITNFTLKGGTLTLNGDVKGENTNGDMGITTFNFNKPDENNTNGGTLILGKENGTYRIKTINGSADTRNITFQGKNATLTVTSEITSAEKTTNLNLQNDAKLGNNVTVNAGTLNVNFQTNDKTLTLNGGNGNITTNNGGATNFNFDGAGSSSTINGTIIDNTSGNGGTNFNFTNVGDNGDKTFTLKFEKNGTAGELPTGSVNYNFDSSGVTYALQTKTADNPMFKTTDITEGNINFNASGTLTNGILTANTKTTTINVGKSDDSNTPVTATINGEVKNTNSDQGTTNVNFNADSSSLTLKLGSQITTLDFKDKTGNTLNLGGTTNTIATINNAGTGTTINLAGKADERGNPPLEEAENFRTLTVNNYDTDNIKFVVYADTTSSTVSNKLYKGDGNLRAGETHEMGGSDKVVITTRTAKDSETTTNSTLSLAVKEIPTIQEPAYAVLAEVDSGAKDKVIFNGLSSSEQSTDLNSYTEGGFTTTTFTLNRKDTGEKAYYFTDLSKIKAVTINPDVVSPTLSALSTNYNLMSVNLNSLSKRLGELRVEGANQGAWGRVFAGEEVANFGIEAKSQYVTLQAGYDYGIDIEGGRNYMGLALSYTNSSTSQAKKAYQVGTDSYVVGLNSAKTNGVEAALYNSLITTSGLYSDSIVKFGYYSSHADMALSEKSYDINNIAIALSQEVGYKLALGKNSEWLITPQAEVAYAFMNKTDLDQVRTVGDVSNTLKSVMEGVSTIRARVGAHWGYSFDHLLDQNSGVKSNLYVGTSYEYDVVSGGEVSFETTSSNLSQKGQGVVSNGRFVLNVGGNVNIQEATSIYADFESSFGEKLHKTYQVNLGVRYAFGEGKQKVEQGNKEEVNKAPLKIEEVE